MNNYSFFKKIIYSFYSKDVYAYVEKSETSKTGLKYLLLLISIFWIPEIVKIHLEINHYIKNELPLFVEKLPIVKIVNGTASFNKPTPYIVTGEKSGSDIVIFDTSGQYTSLEKTNAMFLVTSNKMFVKKNDIETREFNFTTINDFTLTHEKIFSWAEWGNYISILIYILIIPLVFIYMAIQALLYAGIGLIFQSYLKTNYTFLTIYRLSILAITPAFIIDKFLSYFELNLRGWFLAYLVLSLTYLFFALKENKPAEQ